MSFLSDARSLTPKNKIVLVEVDGTEFGAGIQRMHYAPMPHSASEILDAANVIYGADPLRASTPRNGTKTATDLGIMLTSTADDVGVSFSNINQPGGTYQGVRFKYRWVNKPDNDQFQVYFSNAAHAPNGSNVKGGSLSGVSTDIGDGWLQADIDMGSTGDWASSTITGIRFDPWQSGSGSMEIREMALINIDTNATDSDRLRPKSIWWNGLEFSYWPFVCEGIEFSSAQQSNPTLSVGNLSGVIAALCRAYDQMVNAKVRVIQTTVEFLDARNFPAGNDSADPNESWVQLYYIDQMDYEDDEYCRFNLSSPLDLQGLQIPTRQVTTFCIWQSRGLYAKGLDIEEENGCNWNLNQAGIKYYDAKGNEVSDASKDRCGGCVKDCRLRFGQLYDDPKAAKLPFGGFPASSLIS